MALQSLGRMDVRTFTTSTALSICFTRGYHPFVIYSPSHPYTPQFHPRILSSPPPQHLFILIISYHTKEPSFSLMFLLARTVYATSFTHSHYEYEGQSTTLYQGCVRILDIIIIKTINTHSLTLDLQGFHRRYHNHLYVRVSGWFVL